MFKTKNTSDMNQKTTSTQDHTIIGKNCQIKGDLQCDGDLRIDGVTEGNIVSNGRLVVGKEAKIKGNIRCNSAEFHGTVVGDTHCDGLLILKPTANVEGSIKVTQFALEQGAVLNTNLIDMRGDRPTPQDIKPKENQ